MANREIFSDQFNLILIIKVSTNSSKCRELACSSTEPEHLLRTTDKVGRKVGRVPHCTLRKSQLKKV